MFPRDMTHELLIAAQEYPVVTLIGPRQSGKTTLCKSLFPNKPYINLESPDVRELALTDPRGLLTQHPEGVILDEIQRAPQLLSYIQAIVDEADKPGHFILTGSHQFELHQAIVQSLAGRTALLTLLPMSIKELTDALEDQSLNSLLLHGGYPRIYKNHLDPNKAYRNYFHTYVEKDLRQMVNVRDLAQFEKFVRLCAGRIGQLLNLESLGNEVGVSSNTIKHWISLLEASFIIFRLQPYFENFGKRIIKSAKLYFVDVGLASYLLGIENETQMSRDPLRGHLVENLVISELLKSRLNKGLDPHLYFFRDVQGREVDVIYQIGNQLIPIEIKSSATYSRDLMKNLQYFHQLVEDRCPHGYLVYTGEYEQKVGTFELLNYKHSSLIVSNA